MGLTRAFGWIVFGVLILIGSLVALRCRFGAGRTIVALLFATYLSIIISLLLLPMPLNTEGAVGYPSVPILLFPGSYVSFILQRISSVQLGGVLAAVAVQAITFVPMGFFLPVLFKKCREARHAVWALLSFAVTLELLQFLQGVIAGVMYRSVSSDEAFVCFAGGLMGFLLYTLCQHFFFLWKGQGQETDGAKKPNHLV